MPRIRLTSHPSSTGFRTLPQRPNRKKADGQVLSFPRGPRRSIQQRGTRKERKRCCRGAITHTSTACPNRNVPPTSPRPRNSSRQSTGRCLGAASPWLC
jgi:hypothetical protein